MMKTGVALGGILSLLFMCSCTTNKSIHSELPGEVTMNQDAGRGGLLRVTIRVDHGDIIPFVLDTGAPVTLLDRSLESKLGNRLDSGDLWNFGVKQEAHAYAAPPFYLQNARLTMSGKTVVTYDRNRLASAWTSSAKGVLGMDVLGNYCIQLDFISGTVRFLDSRQADKSEWGRPFPLKDVGDGCLAIDENFAGAKDGGSLIDTGCDSYGWLTAALFQQWTNHPQTSLRGENVSTNGVLGGETYVDLDLHQLTDRAASSDDAHMKYNGIGLRVLAQNLVTLDFPNRTMYLKRTSSEPLQDKATAAAMKRDGKSALRFLMRLKKQGRLPGWSKSDEMAGDTAHIFFSFPDSATFDDLKKKGDASVYHYVVNRTSKHEPWRLQKAWRADQNDKTVETYVTP